MLMLTSILKSMSISMSKSTLRSTWYDSDKKYAEYEDYEKYEHLIKENQRSL